MYAPPTDMQSFRSLKPWSTAFVILQPESLGCYTLIATLSGPAIIQLIQVCVISVLLCMHMSRNCYLKAESARSVSAAR